MKSTNDRKNILVSSLGQSWAVIPEVMAFLTPPSGEWLYANHPRADEIAEQHRKHDLGPVDELWICTTDDQYIASQIERVRQWLGQWNPAIVLRIFTAKDVSDLDAMPRDGGNAAPEFFDRVGMEVKEMIFRVVFHAARQVRKTGGRLFLSLAGGRKTMSADMQQASYFFGADALLHVIAPSYREMTDAMKHAAPELFLEPLSQADCRGLYPLVLGHARGSPLVNFLQTVEQGFSEHHFTLTIPAPGEITAFVKPAGEKWLVDELAKRQAESEALMTNFYSSVIESDKHENWRSLYRLPPEFIAFLQSQRLNRTHEQLVRQLPKADLHCHLGGCLALAQQKNVAQVIVTERRIRHADIPEFWRKLSEDSTDWPVDWAKRLRATPNRGEIAAWLAVNTPEDKLRYELYERYPRFGLGQRDFALYELPGELTGSAQLCFPEVLSSYTSEIIAHCMQFGVRYLELRGSPQKYFYQLDAQIEFLKRLKFYFDEVSDRLIVRFIVSLDRRRPATWHSTVTLVTEAHRATEGFVVGVDVAGDESQQTKETTCSLADALAPIYQLCMPVTIHAGEGTSAENIWDAAYQLHADRIGHGLKLYENPELLQRIRNRDIGIEMCPTSNIEVVGFSTRLDAHAERHEAYPLWHYWQAGVPLSICSDNPGISQTNMVNEYLVAADLCQHQLSLWDFLAMLKQGFVHAFLPASEKERLLKALDRQIYDLVADYVKTQVNH